MDDFKIIEFKQSELFIRLIIANICLALCVSLVHFLKTSIILGLGWLLIGSIWSLNYFLRTHIPFCRITEDEIIFPNPMNKFTKRISWKKLEKIERITNNKLVFIMVDNKNIKINLIGMNKEKRLLFVETVNKIFDEIKQK